MPAHPHSLSWRSSQCGSGPHSTSPQHSMEWDKAKLFWCLWGESRSEGSRDVVALSTGAGPKGWHRQPTGMGSHVGNIWSHIQNSCVCMAQWEDTWFCWRFSHLFLFWSKAGIAQGDILMEMFSCPAHVGCSHQNRTAISVAAYQGRHPCKNSLCCSWNSASLSS